MSQLSFPLFDSLLHVRDVQGHYLLATAEQILQATREAIDSKMQRGMACTAPALVKGYLIAKLAGFEREVFAVLFLDAQHRLIEYVEMFRGTLDSAEVHPREMATNSQASGRCRQMNWTSPPGSWTPDMALMFALGQKQTMHLLKVPIVRRVPRQERRECAA